MGHSADLHRILCFGSFEVDVVSGELRRQGLKIRLQDQPFRLLVLLLDHPGDVVTREKVRETLWPAETHVDFDHSLNTAVRKLREALGDSAEAPRYVETLARRGYRFIAPVAPRTTAQAADRANANAAVASDGSTWNGGGSGAGWSPFKLTATLSSPQPGLAGYLYARVRAAKASATFYIDPKIVLT